MKKILIVMLMSLLVISGCAANNDDEGKDTENDVTLQVAGLEGGYGTKGWEKVVEAFTEETGIDVELTLAKNISDELRPQIQAGDVPDVIYLAIGAEGKLTDTMISEEIITDISDVLDMEIPGEDTTVEEKVLPGFYDTLRSKPYGDDKVYLSPVFYSPTGLFYNQGIFDEKGWDLPETWDEMWALGDEAAKEDIALYTYAGAGYHDSVLASLLNITAGPEDFDKLMNYDLETWKKPEAKRAFEILGKLAEYTKDETAARTREEFQKNQAMVMENKALFQPNGTWLPGEMEESGAPSAEGFEWGFTTLPVENEGDEKFASTFTEEVYIPEGAEHEAEAKEFIAFLYSDKATEIFINESGQVQPTVNAFDMLPEDSENKLYYAIYDDGDVTSNTMGFADVEPVEGVNFDGDGGVLYNSIDSVVLGDMTADEWYNSVVDAIEKLSENME